MASLGKVGNKVLRVALCLVKVEGVPAVPIDDVQKLVDKLHGDGFLTHDLVRSEGESTQVRLRERVGAQMA